MKKRSIRLVALVLVFAMACPLGLLAAVTPVPAKATPATEEKPAPSPAPAKHVKAIRAAAKAGLLDAELASRKTMTDVEVTDALVALSPVLLKIDPKTLRSGGEGPDTVVFEDLLETVVEKKGAIRDRKVSAYTMEKRLQAIVAALGDETRGDEKVEAKPAATPVPAVTEADLKAVRDALSRLSDELADFRKSQESRLAAVEKSRGEDLAKVSGVQDDLSLIRDNLDSLQANLKILAEREAAIEKKVEEKGNDADAQKREWSIMRKDIRDHSQDLSVLKQKVEKLMAPEKSAASPLDKALSSKWVPGAAILLSLGAIALAASQ